MNNNGLVSVVIPTYHQSALLERALHSVVSQTYDCLEILVVNDNGEDSEYTPIVRNIISQLSDSRIRLITPKIHKNGAAARNVGIKESIGEYIAFLDDDDYWVSNKIEKQIAVLSNLSNEWGGVACKNIAIRNGEVYRALSGFKENNLCRNIMMRNAEISTDNILLRRSALFETGLFDENLKRNQEVQLLVYFTNKYKIKLLDEYLVYVDSNASPNQPSPQNMELIKKDFLESIRPIICQYPKKYQKAIYYMNAFEIGILMIRNQQYLRGIKLVSGVILSPLTTVLSIKYVARKLVASHKQDYNLDELGVFLRWEQE